MTDDERRTTGTLRYGTGSSGTTGTVRYGTVRYATVRYGVLFAFRRYGLLKQPLKGAHAAVRVGGDSTPGQEETRFFPTLRYGVISLREM